MPAPLSPDIRNRFQVLHREGLSAREIGRRLLISAVTAVRFADRLRRTGDLTPAANSRRQAALIARQPNTRRSAPDA